MITIKIKYKKVARRHFVALCHLSHEKRGDEIFKSLVSEMKSRICSPKDLSNYFVQWNENNKHWANEILSGYKGRIKIKFITYTVKK
jgi:hypothetical protein